MKHLTKEQAIVISGFTSTAFVPFDVYCADVEKRLGRTVESHEFIDKEFVKNCIEPLYSVDFEEMTKEFWK